jgi:hypothetical protein
LSDSPSLRIHNPSPGTAYLSPPPLKEVYATRVRSARI